jgi:type VI secretion system (T6SS) effector TldE1-like protein
MNTSARACHDFAGYAPRNSSRKVVSHNLLGSVAVACLVVACGWTIYSNVFGASIYPAIGGSNFDVAVANRSAPAGSTALTSAGSSILVETPPVASAPATVPQGPTLSFEDRFAAAAPRSVEPSRQAVAPSHQVAALAPAPDRQDADIVPMPAARPAEAQPAKRPRGSVREMAQRAKAAVLAAAAPPEKPSIFERLFGKLQSSGSALAYASADADATSSLGPSSNIASAGTSTPLYDRQTAVYDISAHMVYLPDGTKLEAHSGLGASLDDPRSASIRMRGVTPPHLYDLKPREALFHGVAALRLTPVGGEGAIYGRAGLLAHTFMLGPNGDSNGCVSFRDYSAFLNAYRNQGVRRLAVVAHL